VKRILKIAGYVVGVFIIFFIGSGVGSSGAEVTLNDKVETVTSLDAKIEGKTNKLEGISKEYEQAKELIANIDKNEKELADVEAKLKDTQGALDAELSEGRAKIEADLAIVENGLKTKQAELDAVNEKLASVTGQLQKAESQPITLSAGTYTVGQDVPAGRYTVTPVGEGSNFFVYGSSGYADVNTILGSWGEESYTFYTSAGDSIQTEAKVKLTPMK
jgi:septal ring factor EnvC (AmiA/AmiB activator)